MQCTPEHHRLRDICPHILIDLCAVCRDCFCIAPPADPSTGYLRALLTVLGDRELPADAIIKMKVEGWGTADISLVISGSANRRIQRNTFTSKCSRRCCFQPSHNFCMNYRLVLMAPQIGLCSATTERWSRCYRLQNFSPIDNQIMAQLEPCMQKQFTDLCIAVFKQHKSARYWI